MNPLSDRSAEGAIETQVEEEGGDVVEDREEKSEAAAAAAAAGEVMGWNGMGWDGPLSRKTVLRVENQ